MAIKRIVPNEQVVLTGEKGKLKARFAAKMETANTVAELKKCIKILSRHVFDEKDGE